jgi:hypothetical protein
MEVCAPAISIDSMSRPNDRCPADGRPRRAAAAWPRCSRAPSVGSGRPDKRQQRRGRRRPPSAPRQGTERPAVPFSAAAAAGRPPHRRDRRSHEITTITAKTSSITTLSTTIRSRARNRLEQQPPQPRQIEHILDDDRTRPAGRRPAAQNRQHRDQRVAQPVPAQRLARRQPLGPRGADEIRAPAPRSGWRASPAPGSPPAAAPARSPAASARASPAQSPSSQPGKPPAGNQRIVIAKKQNQQHAEPEIRDRDADLGQRGNHRISTGPPRRAAAASAPAASPRASASDQRIGRQGHRHGQPAGHQIGHRHPIGVRNVPRSPRSRARRPR